jgi:hypothetical protein
MGRLLDPERTSAGISYDLMAKVARDKDARLYGRIRIGYIGTFIRGFSGYLRVANNG